MAPYTSGHGCGCLRAFEGDLLTRMTGGVTK